MSSVTAWVGPVLLAMLGAVAILSGVMRLMSLAEPSFGPAFLVVDDIGEDLAFVGTAVWAAWVLESIAAELREPTLDDEREVLRSDEARIVRSPRRS